MTSPSEVVCSHQRTRRGADIPRRWGSYRSEVCTLCGDFRTLTHHNDPVGKWQPASEYAKAIVREEDW